MRDALYSLALSHGPEKSANAIADAIRSGKLTIYAKVSNLEVDEWECFGDNNQQRAPSAGLTLSELVGPRSGDVALSPLFWIHSEDLSTKLLEAQPERKLLIAAQGHRKRGKPKIWELREPLVLTLQMDALRVLIEAGINDSPRPQRRGRYRSPAWEHWTARLAEYVHVSGMASVANEDELALELQRQLHEAAIEPPDLTSAKKTLRTVIAHWVNVENPPKS